MTTTHHQSDARLRQLGQAVERLLDAMADSADQGTGSITYTCTTTSPGRWMAGQHRCGIGTITTAERNGLVTVEETSSTAKTLTLTETGRHHVEARTQRKAARS